MSRLEYMDDNIHNNDFQQANPFKIGTACATCYEQHVADQVGFTSTKLNCWFCSGACQTLYWHDNKLVIYAPNVVEALEAMRKKHYTKEKLDKNRKHKHVRKS
jgi:hypothetical protein